MGTSKLEILFVCNTNHMTIQLFAAPSVGEKGYMDLELKVETLGGHSSVPRKCLTISSVNELSLRLEPF